MGVTNGRGVENITDCILAAMFNCLPHASLTLVFFRVEGEQKSSRFLFHVNRYVRFLDC